jgi:hypothetical protein
MMRPLRHAPLRGALLIVSLIAILALSACGGDDGPEANPDDGKTHNESTEAGTSDTGEEPDPTAAAASARYRVLVSGFSVKSPTWDHALEVDGKGDEVYVSSTVTRVKPTGETVLSADRTSETMGDTNGQSGRIQAGTKPCCWLSDKTNGGLRENDKFPTGTPWTLSDAPSAERNYPPMTLWEGELVQGGDAVIVAPSIWEWDGGKDAYSSWIKWGQQTGTKVGPKLAEIFGPQAKPYIEGAQIGLDVAVSMSEVGLTGQASDRPIGMEKIDGGAKFNPKVFSLTYETAEIAVKQNLTGFGEGIFGVRFKDHDDWRGDYTLYVRIEKVGDGSGSDSPAGAGRGTRFADVTGDGRDDAITIRNEGVFVRRSTGTAFAESANWSHEPYYGSRDTEFADVTGDGRADAIAVSNDGVFVRASTGKDFAPWTGVAWSPAS